MGQGQRRCAVVFAGLVGLALLARTPVTRVGSSQVVPPRCPDSGVPITDGAPLLFPALPDAGRPALDDPAASSFFLYPDGREPGDLFGYACDAPLPATAPAQLPEPAGLSPALADIHAAATGTLSLDDDADPGDDLPSRDAAPAPALPPLLPEGPAVPDPRALLA